MAPSVTWHQVVLLVFLQLSLTLPSLSRFHPALAAKAELSCSHFSFISICSGFVHVEENCAASNIRPSGSAYIYSDVLLEGKMSDVGNVNCICVFTLLKKRRWDGMREGEELKKNKPVELSSLNTAVNRFCWVNSRSCLQSLKSCLWIPVVTWRHEHTVSSLGGERTVQPRNQDESPSTECQAWTQRPQRADHCNHQHKDNLTPKWVFLIVHCCTKQLLIWKSVLSGARGFLLLLFCFFYFILGHSARMIQIAAVTITTHQCLIACNAEITLLIVPPKSGCV